MMEVNNNSQGEDGEGNLPENTWMISDNANQNGALSEGGLDGKRLDNNPTLNYTSKTNLAVKPVEDLEGYFLDTVNPSIKRVDQDVADNGAVDIIKPSQSCLEMTNYTLDHSDNAALSEQHGSDNINPSLNHSSHPTVIQTKDEEGNYQDYTDLIPNLPSANISQTQPESVEGSSPDNTNLNLTNTTAAINSGEGLTLIVGGEEMVCSREKLSSTSDYFKAMFDSNMKESTSDCIVLEQVDPYAMKIILEYLVTGRLDLTQENVHIVTETACMFQIKVVMDLCCEMMDDLLNDDNCLAILSLTHTFALEELYLKAKRHCLWYFSDVVQTSNLVDLDVNLLCEILSDRKLVVKSEMKVYDAIEKWVSHDLKERKTYLEELLPLIRIEVLEEEEITILRQQAMVQDYQEVFDNVETSSPDTQRYRAVPYCLWSLGGQEDPDNDIYASDDELDVEPPPKILRLSDIDKTCTFESIPIDEQDHPSVIQQETGYSACVHGKDVYVSGGLTSLGPGRNTWLMDVWKLDTFTSVWEFITQLRTPRRHHTMICVGESLILIGGFGKYRMKLKTCEEFNLKTGEWKDLPSMPEESFLIAACATSSNRIYAFKSRAFYYDLGALHWNKVASSEYSMKKLVPSTAVYIPSKDSVYIVSRYHKDLLQFNLSTQTLSTVGQFRYGEAASNAVVHKDRVCRFAAPGASPVLEWYDVVKGVFGWRADPVDGISVLNFHLLPIPNMIGD